MSWRTSSPADAWRSSGSLESPRQIAAAAASGVPGTNSDRSGGGCATTRCATSIAVLPLIALRPLSVSNATAASAYTSTPGPPALPSSRSGAMYAAVPSTVPLRVICVRSAAVAMPRSASFASPCGVTRMFAGFTSRWITPCWCASSSAAATPQSSSSAGPGSSGPSASSSRSVPPSTYSMTMRTLSSSGTVS